MTPSAARRPRLAPIARRALVLGAVAATSLGAFGARAATLEVCATCDHTTVRAALAAAAPGDTVRLAAGTYREGALVIDKPLTLEGVGWPVLDGEGEVQILTVAADHVTVRGLELRHSGVSYTEDLAALKAFSVTDCTIEGNRVEDAFFAIYLGKVADCTVARNEVRGRARSEAFSGNAIHVWNARDVTIEGNDVRGHRDGIYLEFVEGSAVVDNVSRDNLRYGLHFMFSNDNLFRANTFRANGAGVAVMYSKRIQMIRNRFVDNWGAAAFGLLLKEIDDSLVGGNTFERNTVGVYADGSNRTDLDGNDFLRNGYALRVLSSSMALRVMHNNFIGNTFDVITNSDRSYNAYLENYWDAYDGYDLDHDGVGDVPYRPVRLFAMTVETYPQAVLLLRSPLATVMDYAERLLPVLTPKAIEDDRPRMRRLE